MKAPPVKITPQNFPHRNLSPVKIPRPLGKLPPMKSSPHLEIIKTKEKTKSQNFLP